MGNAGMEYQYGGIKYGECRYGISVWGIKYGECRYGISVWGNKVWGMQVWNISMGE